MFFLKSNIQKIFLQLMLANVEKFFSQSISLLIYIQASLSSKILIKTFTNHFSLLCFCIQLAGDTSVMRLKAKISLFVYTYAHTHTSLSSKIFTKTSINQFSLLCFYIQFAGVTSVA